MSQPWSPPPAGAPANIPNYLIPAILSTLFCCLPAGVVSIVFATQVNSKIAAGDIAGATESSGKAKMFMFVSIGLGLLVWVVVIILWIFAFGAALVGGNM
jgi:hypothetical protein